MDRKFCFLSLALLITYGNAVTKDTGPLPASHAPAVVVQTSEIQESISKPATGGTKDVVLRVIPVDGEYNLGVSVVRRWRVNGKTMPDALQHHAISEVYQVLRGCGTLVTGGNLRNPKELLPNDPDVRTQIGPTAEGVAIDGGVSQRIVSGDIVVIPTNAPHGFSEICPEGITYSVVRMDFRRVLRERTAAK